MVGRGRSRSRNGVCRRAGFAAQVLISLLTNLKVATTNTLHLFHELGRHYYGVFRRHFPSLTCLLNVNHPTGIILKSTPLNYKHTPPEPDSEQLCTVFMHGKQAAPGHVDFGQIY